MSSGQRNVEGKREMKEGGWKTLFKALKIAWAYY